MSIVDKQTLKNNLERNIVRTLNNSAATFAKYESAPCRAMEARIGVALDRFYNNNEIFFPWDVAVESELYLVKNSLKG